MMGDYMRPFLRLSPHRNLKSMGGESDGSTPSYQEKLTKLIPAEVVALYLGGKNAIEAFFATPANAAGGDVPMWWWGWTIVCVVGLFIYRAWATSDAKIDVPPDYLAVIIAMISFVIWVYGFGDAFRVSGLWHPLLATLLVLAWTFLAPKLFERFVRG